MLNRRVHCICRPGYAGALCDRCAPGYFGEPNGLAGRCAACECDADGTATGGVDECDELTGQCNCKPGLTGRRCDRCDARRSMLQDGACRVCDNCTLTLLDRGDELRDMLASGAGHLDPNGIPAPWLKLWSFENQTTITEARVNEAIGAAEFVRDFDDAIVEKLQSRATHLEKRVLQLTAGTDGRANRAGSLLGNANDLQLAAQRCHADILHTIDALNTYGLQTHHVNLPAAAAEARLILEDLRMRHADGTAAAETLACARQDFERWHMAADILQDQAVEVEAIRFNATRLQARVLDAASLAHNTLLMTAAARAGNAENQRNYEMLRDHEQLIQKLKDEVQEALNNSLVAQTDVVADEYRDGAEKLAADVQTIHALREQLAEAIAEEKQDLTDIHADILPQATQHSSELKRRADEYERLFANSRNGAELAIRASSAHADIVAAIEAAKLAGQQSVEAVRETDAQLRNEGGAGDASIIQRGMESLRQSGEIERAAEAEFRKLDGKDNQVHCSLCTI